MHQTGIAPMTSIAETSQAVTRQLSDAATPTEQMDEATGSATEQQQKDNVVSPQHPAYDPPPTTVRERTTVDSVLDAVLEQAAMQSNDGTGSQPGPLAEAASASMDSLLDGVLQEAADALNTGGFTTEHTVAEAPADNAAVDYPASQHAENRSGGGALADDTTSVRSTAEPSVSCGAAELQQLASQEQQDPAVLQQDAVSSNIQPRGTADQVLDAVLEQVAAEASRQRTTADSILDAVLRDVDGGGLHISSRQASGLSVAEAEAVANGVDEGQEEGYASQASFAVPRMVVMQAKPSGHVLGLGLSAWLGNASPMQMQTVVGALAAACVQKFLDALSKTWRPVTTYIIHHHMCCE